MKIFIRLIILFLLFLAIIVTVLVLQSRSIIDKNKAATKDIEGYLEAANCSFLKGWVANPEALDIPLKVDIYMDGDINKGKKIYSNTATIERKDIDILSNTYTGAKGFNVKPPKEVFDNKLHSLYIYAVDSTDSQNFLLLPNSPQNLQCK